jgi:hypothetical protein
LRERERRALANEPAANYGDMKRLVMGLGSHGW